MAEKSLLYKTERYQKVEDLSLSSNEKKNPKSRICPNYLAEIVSAATMAPPGMEFNTSLRCRRRPKRKPCQGHIRLLLQEVPPELQWWCSECSDNGTIKNWKGIPWDRSRLHWEDSKKDTTYYKIHLREEEYSLLAEIAIVEPQAHSFVENAIQINAEYLLVGAAHVINDVIGYIAFEANHETNKRRQRALDCIYEKIRKTIGHH